MAVPQKQAGSPSNFRPRACSGFSDGSLLVVRSRWRQSAPLQLEGALIPPPGPETACSGPGQAGCASPGMEPQPRGNPLPLAGRSAPKVWSYGQPQWAGSGLWTPAQRAGLVRRNTAPAGR